MQDDLMTLPHSNKLQVFKLTKALARFTAFDSEGVKYIPVNRRNCS